MHAYVYGYVYASIILLDTLRRRLSVHRCAYACICICVCMYACICARVYACICIYVCLCICMHIHLYTHKRVVLHMHSCRRILFICTVQSLYYMRVYHRCSITPACVCLTGVFFTPAFGTNDAFVDGMLDTHQLLMGLREKFLKDRLVDVGF